MERFGTLSFGHYGPLGGGRQLSAADSMLQAIDEDRALFGIDAQQYLTGYYPVIFLAMYDKYGMVPTSNVLTGPLFVTKDTAKQVIELSAQGYR